MSPTIVVPGFGVQALVQQQLHCSVTISSGYTSSLALQHSLIVAPDVLIFIGCDVRCEMALSMLLGAGQHMQCCRLSLCRQQPPSGNKLAVHLDTGNPYFQRSSWQAAVYVAAGRDPLELCDVAVATAGCLTGWWKGGWSEWKTDVLSGCAWSWLARCKLHVQCGCGSVAAAKNACTAHPLIPRRQPAGFSYNLVGKYSAVNATLRHTVCG